VPVNRADPGVVERLAVVGTDGRQQRALGFWRGAVDLVSQNDLREQGTGAPAIPRRSGWKSIAGCRRSATPARAGSLRACAPRCRATGSSSAAHSRCSPTPDSSTPCRHRRWARTPSTNSCSRPARDSASTMHRHWPCWRDRRAFPPGSWRATRAASATRSATTGSCARPTLMPRSKCGSMARGSVSIRRSSSPRNASPKGSTPPPSGRTPCATGSGRAGQVCHQSVPAVALRPRAGTGTAAGVRRPGEGP